MLTQDNLNFLALLFNSLICRRPFFLVVDGTEQGSRLREVLSFLPAHRYSLLAGAVPKWAKRMGGQQSNELPPGDVSELTQALASSFDEEQFGRRPVQFIYFGAGTETYEGVLKSLEKGWVASTSDLESILKSVSASRPYYMNGEWDGVTALYLGEKPRHLDFETEFLERVKGRSTALAAFLVQKKFSELHLAGDAVLRELEESGGTMSLVDIEETFDLNPLTAQKMLELVEAEYGLDIRRYIVLPPAEATATVDKLARVGDVIAVAAVDGDNVLSIKRLRTADFGISAAARLLAGLYGCCASKPLVGDCLYMTVEFSDFCNVLLITRGQMTYVVFLGKESIMGLSVAAILEELNQKS